MNASTAAAPRILILETDRRTCAALRRYAVKGWHGASVQSNGATLADVARDPAQLKTFDVVLAGCDFGEDGSSANPVFNALRAICADPANPAVVLLTHGGSEYTAVQAIKAGAFDYIPRELLGREQTISTVQRAIGRRQHRSDNLGGVVQLFGYDVRRCLARHDNVSVHVAYSAERADQVVLKVLHRGRGSLSRDVNFHRFVEEFKLLYDIEDPAVAEIYDFRVTSQYCYIAMEYFRAGHLGARVDGPLEPETALRYAKEIAKALAIVHAAGVVHRDLKPGNVMLREERTLALIDFGISQSVFGAGAAGFDGTRITGTPYYMSPEQARGEPTDERTDLYALGVILYQMLTGEKPYPGQSADQILERHCNAPIPRLPAELAPLQPLVDRLLAKSAEQRLATAREVIEAIDAARALVGPYGLSARSA